MHDFVAITPLGGIEPRVDAFGGATLTEVTDKALASVAARLGREADAAAIVSDFIETAAPNPGHVAGQTLSAFWMGPNQWMVEAPFDTHEDLAAQVVAKSNGAVSVTEQTDGWCRFDVSGENLVAVFELLCPFDLRSCKGGEATRTTIDHLGCFILCRSSTHVSVLGPRSAAGSLHHALLTAIKSAL